MNERRGSNVEWGDDLGITYDVQTRWNEEGERKATDGKPLDKLLGGTEIYE